MQTQKKTDRPMQSTEAIEGKRVATQILDEVFSWQNLLSNEKVDKKESIMRTKLEFTPKCWR